MYIKENVIRLVFLLLFIVFAGCLFFSVKYMRAASEVANNPSSEVVKTGSTVLDAKVLNQIITKVNQ